MGSSWPEAIWGISRDLGLRTFAWRAWSGWGRFDMGLVFGVGSCLQGAGNEADNCGGEAFSVGSGA